MKLVQWAITSRGRRRENEDAIQTTGLPVLIDEATYSGQLQIRLDGVVVAIADGVGGQPGGRTAAQVGLAELCSSAVAGNERTALLRTIEASNEKVLALASPSRRPASTVAGISVGTRRVLVFNIGDTRIYSYEGNRPYLLSVDHRSTIDARSITRFLGGSAGQATPQIREMPATARDFLICSDGFYAFLKTDDLLLPRMSDPAEALQILLEMALANGSNDNLSAVYCSIRL